MFNPCSWVFIDDRPTEAGSLPPKGPNGLLQSVDHVNAIHGHPQADYLAELHSCSPFNSHNWFRKPRLSAIFHLGCMSYKPTYITLYKC